MAMPALLPRYTIADLAQFPDDGYRYELVEGHLLVTPKPLPPHEMVTWRLSRLFTAWTLDHPGVMVLLGGTVDIAPGTHLEPDLLLMPEFTQVPAKWLGVSGHLLAVEVSGRGSRIYDRDYKRPAYLAAGVREFWRVDLRDRCVYVATQHAPTERAITDAVTWTPPEGGDGVTIRVDELFEGISDTVIRE